MTKTILTLAILTTATVLAGCGPASEDEGAPALEAAAPACGFDGRAFSAARGAGLYSDPGSGARHLAAPVAPSASDPYHVSTTADLCISQSASDSLSVVERALIQSFGCSAPYYFEAYNAAVTTPANHPANGAACVAGVDGWSCWFDNANGYPQLCPYTDALHAYVDGLGKLTNASGQASDLRAHFAGDRDLSFDVEKLVPSAEQGPTPSAPAGYVWVIPWEDPHACAGGCMVSI